MRRLLGIIIPFLFVVLTAPAASAASWTHGDGTGDMSNCSTIEEVGCEPAPDQTVGDITNVQLNHNRRYVQMFVTLRDTDRTMNTDVEFMFENGRHQYRRVEIHTYPRFGKPDGVFSIKDGHHRVVHCKGTKGFRIAWDSNVAAVTLPRTCFNSPERLRMRATFGNGGPSGDYPYYSDDATTATPPDMWHYVAAPWGPWVRRG